MTQSEQPMASPERGRETGDLECEISRLERAEKELRQAKERAEAVSEAKSLFLADMSHEILTPLAGVIGMADLLLETSLDADQSRFAKAIQSNARRLLGVISDILDFSKIEAGQLTLAPVDFDLSAILHESSNSS